MMMMMMMTYSRTALTTLQHNYIIYIYWPNSVLQHWNKSEIQGAPTGCRGMWRWSVCSGLRPVAKPPRAEECWGVGIMKTLQLQNLLSSLRHVASSETYVAYLAVFPAICIHHPRIHACCFMVWDWLSPSRGGWNIRIAPSLRIQCSQFPACEIGSFKVSKLNLGILQGRYHGFAIILNYWGEVFFWLACVFFGGECLFHFTECPIVLLSWQSFWDGTCALNEVGWFCDEFYEV